MTAAEDYRAPAMIAALHIGMARAIVRSERAAAMVTVWARRQQAYRDALPALRKDDPRARRTEFLASAAGWRMQAWAGIGALDGHQARNARRHFHGSMRAARSVRVA